MSKILIFLSIFVISTFAKAQTADEVIDKHLAAIGGKDSLRTIKSTTRDASMVVQGADVNIKMQTLCGIGIRNDILVMGMSGFDIVTPKEGWKLAPWTGSSDTRTMTNEELINGKLDLDCITPLLDYKSKGGKVELLQMDKVDGVVCHQIKYTNTTDTLGTIYYFDARTFMNVKRVKKVAQPDQEGVVTEYSDFKKVGIFTFPFKMVIPIGEMAFSKIMLNPTIDESLFKP